MQPFATSFSSVPFGNPPTIPMKTPFPHACSTVPSCPHVTQPAAVRPTPWSPTVATGSACLILSKDASVCRGVGAMPPTATAGVCMEEERVSSIRVLVLRTERMVAPPAPSWPWRQRRSSVSCSAMICQPSLLLLANPVWRRTCQTSASTCQVPAAGTAAL